MSENAASASDGRSQEDVADAGPAAGRSAYRVEVGDVGADRKAVIALWDGHLGDSAQLEAKYQWFYCDHPRGPSTLLFLCTGDARERVGVSGLGARRMFAAGTMLSAGILADLVVLPEHRTLYPAMLLQKEMNRRGLAVYSVLCGLPNAKGLPVLRRIGYTHAGDLVRYAMVLRHAEYLRRSLPAWFAITAGAVLDRLMPLVFRPHRGLLGGWRFEWLDAFDARFDSLWARAQQMNGIVGERDSAYLSWRFMSRAGPKPRVFAVSSANGQCVGYAVCDAGSPVLHIMDLFVDPTQSAACRVVLHLLQREAFREGCTSVSLDIVAGEGTRRLLVSAGLRERERSPFYASIGAAAEQTFRGLDWYMTRADFDV